MAPINVLLFLNTSAYGGVEEVVLRLAGRLDRRRFRVHLAAPPALLEAFAPHLDGCAVETLPVRLVSWKQWGEARRLLRYMRERSIHIVNSHMSFATFFAAPLARLAGVPVVIETGHGREGWRKEWTFAVDRVVERLVTANISVSEAYRDVLVNVKRFPRGKIHVVPNGRDLAAFDAPGADGAEALRRRFGLSPAARVILHVGRLQPEKGHRYLIAALPRVLRRFPDTRALFVGDGPLRAELGEMAAASGLERQVIFAGFTDNVAPFYHLAEMVALPSLYEGMPLTAIEAGAARRPLVASAVDGTCEVVVDKETGVLVPPGSVEALAEAILMLLADPEKARRMGQAARRRVEERFSLERQVEETSAVFETCLRQTAAPTWRGQPHAC